MAYGDLKVRNLIWNTGSGDNTVVLSTLLTGSSPNWTGTATGVNLTLSGDLQVNGTTTTINTTTLQVEDKNIEIGKVSSPSDTTADGGGWSLLGATTKTFNWVNATDAWTSSEHIHLGDNKKLLIGTGSDLQIFHTGTYNAISTNNGEVKIIKGTSENIAKFIPDGVVELYYDNSKKFETTSTGINIRGTSNWCEGQFAPWANDTWDLGTSTYRWQDLFIANDIDISDNGKLLLGNSDDLQIYHDGTSSYIDNNTGELQISNAGNTLFIQPKQNENSLKLVPDGAVELYYDGSKKLETHTTGVVVHGNISPDNLYLGDNEKAYFGDGSDLQIYHNGSNSYIQDSGTGNLEILSSQVNIQNAAQTEWIAKFISDGAVELYHNNSKKIETTTAGVTVTGTVSDSKGDLRKIPRNHKTSAYVLVASDSGKCITISTGGVTVNNSVFAEGDAVTIVNQSGSDQTITQGSGFTIFNSADASTGNRTLAGRGMTTLWFTATDTAYISGAGLS